MRSHTKDKEKRQWESARGSPERCSTVWTTTRHKSMRSTSDFLTADGYNNKKMSQHTKTYAETKDCGAKISLKISKWDTFGRAGWPAKRRQKIRPRPQVCRAGCHTYEIPSCFLFPPFSLSLSTLIIYRNYRFCLALVVSELSNICIVGTLSQTSSGNLSFQG